MRRILFVAIALAASVAIAAPAPVGVNLATSPVAALTAVAANAAAGARTFTVANPQGAYGLLVIHANFTWDSASAVILTCSESPDGGSTLYALQDGTTSAGVQALVAASKSKTVSASAKWPMRWDIKGFTFISCVYSATGGGASDLITATYTLSAP